MNTPLIGSIVLVGLPVIWLKFSNQAGAATAFLVGLVIFADSASSSRDERALRSAGMQAVVKPASDTYTEVTRRRSGTKTIKAAITFDTADGRTVTEEASIPDDVLHSFKTGRQVTVTYLPRNPTTYRFDPWQPGAGSGIPAGLVVMAIGALWVYLRRRKG